MMLFNSDIAGRFGMNPRKLGQNRMVVTWDGNDSNDAYLDVRSIYGDGNNQGILLAVTGTDCTCAVNGSVDPISSPLNLTELAARNWFLIGTLNAGTAAKVLQDFKLFSTLWLDFTDSAGSVSIVR
jgi:hypothetical protein